MSGAPAPKAKGAAKGKARPKSVSRPKAKAAPAPAREMLPETRRFGSTWIMDLMMIPDWVLRRERRGALASSSPSSGGAATALFR